MFNCLEPKGSGGAKGSRPSGGLASYSKFTRISPPGPPVLNHRARDVWRYRRRIVPASATRRRKCLAWAEGSHYNGTDRITVQTACYVDWTFSQNPGRQLL